MNPHTAPYGAGAGSFNAAPGPTVRFGAPAPPGGLGAVLPAGITSGPGVGYPNMGLPFPTDGFYHSSANPGWPANNTVPHHYLVMPDKEAEIKSQSFNWHRQLGEAMLCFVRDSNPGHLGRNPSADKQIKHAGRDHKAQEFGVPPESTTVELLEFNQLNERLRRPDRQYESAEQVLREWHLLGVAKSEIAPRRAAIPDEQSYRVLNLIVQGRVPTFNLWGGFVHAGQDLYIVVKKVLWRSDKYWQLIPWSDSNLSRPNLASLVGCDGTLGAWLYVGKAGESILDSSARSRNGDFADTNVLKKLERRLQLHIRV